MDARLAASSGERACRMLAYREALPFYQQRAPRRSALAKAIAKRHGINAAGLLSLLKRHAAESTHNDRRYTLTADREGVLVGVIRGFSHHHLALSRAKIISMVRTAFDLGQDWNGEHWYRDFESRHKSLLHSLLRKDLTPARTSAALLSGYLRYLDSVEQSFQDLQLYPHHIWNVDETPLHVSHSHRESRVLVAREQHMATNSVPLMRFEGTFVPAINAAGDCPFVGIVLPYKMDRRQRRGSAKSEDLPPLSHVRFPLISERKSPIVRYFYSDTGRMNTQIFKRYMEEFGKVRDTLYPGHQTLTFLDHLGAHLQPELILSLAHKGHHTSFLAVHSSELTQPLDQQTFGQFHRVLNHDAADHIFTAMISSSVERLVVLKSLGAAVRKSFSPDIIRKSWLEAGLYPFNKEYMANRGRELYGARTIPLLRGQLSQLVKDGEALVAAALKPAATSSPIVSGYARVVKDRPYTDTELELLVKKQAEEEARAKMRLEEKRQKRAEKRKEREQQLLLKREARSLKKQAVQQAMEQKAERQKMRDQNRTKTHCQVCDIWGKESHRYKRWLWCEHCNGPTYFGVCDSCWEGEGEDVMKLHEATHLPPSAKRRHY